MVVTPMHYTLIVYIDPKVQLPLLQQDLTKYPKSHKISKTDIIAAFSKEKNAPRDRLLLPWQLGNRETKEGTPILWDNASKSKAG